MTTEALPYAPMRADDTRLNLPLFTLREAARYLELPKSTLHQWARAGIAGPSLVTVLAGGRRDAKVPFVGFAEAFVLGAFRRAGVPLQRIRPAVEVLRREIGLDHALASRALYTDGVEILFDHDQRDGLLELTVLRTGQKQFSELVRDYLQRITYGDDGWASELTLPAYRRATVVVDPRRAFGVPLVASGGARVEDLVDRFLGGDSLAEIADDFGVPEPEVEDVIRTATRAAA